MVTMNADKWIFLLAMCFMCVSSRDKHSFAESCTDHCKTERLSATLGSSVVLPCYLGAGNNNLVTWTHNITNSLIRLSSGGRIQFLDHRYGRVKAFPNQGSKGNYSICIDDLKKSDIGCYRCDQDSYCLQVDLLFEKSAMSDDTWLLIYISVCVAALILLSACSYLCWIKCIVPCDNKTQDNANISVIPTGFQVASAPPEEPVRVPVQEQQIGAGNNDLVYENDFQSPANSAQTRTHYGVPGLPPIPDMTQPGQSVNGMYQDMTQPGQSVSGMYQDMTQPGQSVSGMYPDLTQFTIERVESRRTRQRFHIELISRIRQASRSRHYYVNRDEINKQQAMSAQAQSHPRGLKKKKAKDNCEYKNPIYNRSTEYLNQL